MAMNKEVNKKEFTESKNTLTNIKTSAEKQEKQICFALTVLEAPDGNKIQGMGLYPKEGRCKIALT